MALKLHIKLNKDSSTALNSRAQEAKMFCVDGEAEDFYLTKLPSVIHNFPPFSETWTEEESCLVFVANLSLCRTPERGSSEYSKLGIQTLWPQPVQRQIGLPVLYVKLPARKHRARRVLRTTPLLQPNCDGVPLSKLLCILGAQEMGRILKMVGG